VLKKCLDETVKVVDKVRGDNNKLQARVQHVFDYIAALEDKIEENHSQYRSQFRSLSIAQDAFRSIRSPLKDSNF
jgi:peptidoglycan hydrolase CwlO-like protein